MVTILIHDGSPQFDTIFHLAFHARNCQSINLPSVLWWLLSGICLHGVVADHHCFQNMEACVEYVLGFQYVVWSLMGLTFWSRQCGLSPHGYETYSPQSLKVAIYFSFKQGVHTLFDQTQVPKIRIHVSTKKNFRWYYTAVSYICKTLICYVQICRNAWLRWQQFVHRINHHHIER